MRQKTRLKRRFVFAVLALVIALGVATMATFAWYIYSVSAHTTNVHMAAGTGVSLQISSTPGGSYGSAAILEEFVGTLNPVSTNRMQNGFQKVEGFTNGSENQPTLVANLFGKSSDSDYYKTSLYLRTNADSLTVYLSGIGYEDSDEENPISTAIRVGFVIPETGAEYIYSINEAKNPQKQYNTATGQEGYVLDSTRIDGTTVPFTPYTSANFCNYDSLNGVTSLKESSVPLCTISGGGGGDYGEPTQVDIYIWLEGCDEDCTNNLCSTTLSNLALSFAGFGG